MIARLLVDNSAWARLSAPKLGAPRREEILEGLAGGELWVCLPFLLEAGYSAPDARQHADLLADLLALPFARLDQEAERRALDAQSQLARSGQHRLPPSDLMLATIAERHGLDVLHYDHDFDRLRERTDLDFGSEWLAAPGSL